jgi:thiamine pyrophosphokinase
METMRLLIVANGCIKNAEWYSSITSEADKVIAADGGADNCMKLGIVPDYVIGDMDSISVKARKLFGDKSEFTPDPDQDRTDLQKAVELANSLKPDKITIIGAIGERMDHTIANVFCLAGVVAESEIIDENNEIHVVEDSIEISGNKGDIVSVLSLSEVKGLTYEGLKWAVKDMDVPSGWTGVCNEMSGRKAKIYMSSGKIIVIKARDG